MNKPSALFAVIALIIVAVVPIFTVQATNISKSYNTSSPLFQGAVVSLNPEQPNSIEPATVNNLTHLTGVVAADEGDLLTITDEQNESEVQVIGEGEALTLVSNLNGPIEPGDYITASPIEGVAMKANEEPIVLGVATTAFTSSSNSVIRDITTELPSDIVTREDDVYLGSIRVAIKISSNPEVRELGGVAGFIQDISKPFLTRGISMTRLLIAFGVFLATAGLAGWMVTAGVRSSIVSLGRNPLSKTSIDAGLRRVILMASLFMASGFAIIFLLLR